MKERKKEIKKINERRNQNKNKWEKELKQVWKRENKKIMKCKRKGKRTKNIEKGKARKKIEVLF